MSVGEEGDVSSSCEIHNCGISGFVLCRFRAAPFLREFSRRFVHMAEGGGFLCVSKRESAPHDKLICPSSQEGASASSYTSEDSDESEGLLSPLWSKPFLQIQISLDNVDSISEYIGVTPGVSPEYAFGIQGEGRVVAATTSNSSRSHCSGGSSWDKDRDRSSGSNNSSSTSSSVHRKNSESQSQVWALLFPSAQERDSWKEVLLRLLQEKEEATAAAASTSSDGLGRAAHSKSSTDNIELAELASKMFSTVTITDRFIQTIKYSKCFIGGEAIAFLIKTLQCSEEEALRTALRLTSLGWVHHVTFEHFLRNDYLFYQFDERLFLPPPSSAAAGSGSGSGRTAGERVAGCAVLSDLCGETQTQSSGRGREDTLGAEGGEGVLEQDTCLQRQRHRDRIQVHRLVEANEDLKEALKDVSQQATEEISTLRRKLSFLSQWLSVLLATYLCHCAAYVLSYLLYDSALTISSNYIVDTLVYVLNLSILEHFFRVPSYYLVRYIDPDSAHAPFERLINKDSGDLVMMGEEPRKRHDSLDSSSSGSSLLVALSEVGEDEEREQDDSGFSTVRKTSRSHRHRSWSIDSGFSTRNKGRGRLRSGSSEFSSSDTPTPTRYIRGCAGDLEEADQRWAATLEWRKQHGIDHLLKEQQPHFSAIKELYPHFLHGRSVRDADGQGAGGYPVYYHQLYKIDFAKLKERGVTKEHLLRHALFLKEYIFTHVEPNEEDGQIITVLDVKGMGLADVAGEALELWKTHSKVLQSHYIERSHQIFVVNASSMFRMIWKLVKPVLVGSTKRKVKIFREGADLGRLVRCVGTHQLPGEYGGPARVVLGDSEEERLLALFVNRLHAV